MHFSFLSEAYTRHMNMEEKKVKSETIYYFLLHTYYWVSSYGQMLYFLRAWGNAQVFWWPGPDINLLPHSCHHLWNAGAFIDLGSHQELVALMSVSLIYLAHRPFSSCSSSEVSNGEVCTYLLLQATKAPSEIKVILLGTAYERLSFCHR